MRMRNIDEEMDVKRNIANDYSCKKRGEIIAEAISVENNLTDIITWFFYPSKYLIDETIYNTSENNSLILRSLILGSISFRDKIELLKDIVIIKNPEIMNNYIELTKNIFKELDRVRKFRNLLAHSESDLSREFIDSSVNLSNKERINTLQVIEYKKGKLIKHIIDKKKYISEMLVMYRVDTRLDQLYSLLNNDKDMAEKYKKFVDIFNE
jgi:hypothetical protein